RSPASPASVSRATGRSSIARRSRRGWANAPGYPTPCRRSPARSACWRCASRSARSGPTPSSRSTSGAPTPNWRGTAGTRPAAPDVRVERLRDPGAEADIDAVVALENESFSNPWPRETLVWELTNSDVTRVYLVRDDGDRAIAFCIVWIIFDELHINTLAVGQAHRRRGVATFLLREVMAEAARDGA